MKPEDKQFYKAALQAVLACILYVLLLAATIALLPASAEVCPPPPPADAAPEINLRQAQVNAVAWCLWTEARGETAEGKAAVASVILNRSGRSGKSLIGVVFQRSQFSGVGKYVPEWFKQGPEGIRWPAAYDNPADCKAFFECYGLAVSAVSGSFRQTGPWTHYYAHAKCSPYWAEGLSEVQIIGNHTFGITK